MTVVDHRHPVDPDRVATARAHLMSAQEAIRLAEMLDLLADPVRSRVLSALDSVGELCVGDLALALEVSEDAVSYALRLLRAAGMVHGRKDGRIVYYRLADQFPEPLLGHCLRQLISLGRAAHAEEQE